MRISRHRYGASGLSLMEVMIAVLLLGIIIGMVLATVKTSLDLGQGIVEKQNEEMERQAFIDFLDKRFSALPGNGRLDLVFEDSGTHYLSDLTLQNAPVSFTWGGEQRIAKAVQLSTVTKRSGYLDIVLRYYEDEILEGSETELGESSLDDGEPFAEIVLLSDVAYFEWQALNANTMEWQYEWDDRGRMPLQLELVMAIGARGEEVRHVFWIRPKQNPEIAMRQLGQLEQPSQPGVELPPSTNVDSKGGGQ